MDLNSCVQQMVQEELGDAHNKILKSVRDIIKEELNTKKNEETISHKSQKNKYKKLVVDEMETEYPYHTEDAKNKKEKDMDKICDDVVKQLQGSVRKKLFPRKRGPYTQNEKQMMKELFDKIAVRLKHH